jgi:hypothetical protein
MAAMVRQLMIALWLLSGCGGADRERDAAVPADLAGDTRPEPDGPWLCSLPVMAGGSVSCSFTWQCPEGARKLSCGYDVVNNVYDCVCQDLDRGTVDGKLTGPPQTCAVSVSSLVPQINTACGWKLAP